MVGITINYCRIASTWILTRLVLLHILRKVYFFLSRTCLRLCVSCLASVLYVSIGLSLQSLKLYKLRSLLCYINTLNTPDTFPIFMFKFSLLVRYPYFVNSIPSHLNIHTRPIVSLSRCRFDRMASSLIVIYSVVFVEQA